MKLRVTMLALVLLANSQLSNAAGIPVFDSASNLEQINEWTQQLQQWQSTVQHYKSQIDAYKAQLATATGVRDIQSFLYEAKSLSSDLKNLQKNGISLNDLLSNSGSYSSELNSLYSKYKMFNGCGGSTGYSDTCKQIVINRAVALESSSEIQEKINSTVNDISSLANRIEISPDSKESQDLANAISVKSVQLNTLTAQWEMSVKQSELRDKLLQEQKEKSWKEQQKNAPVMDLNNI
jgi:type IV secretion system protein VirB5